MKLAMIAAMAKNRIIGADNDMPWHLPADLKHFKSVTMGKAVIMGRKTYESIGKPLPNRLNIVLTRDKSFQAEGAVVVHSREEALETAMGSDDVMICGGTDIYKMFIENADYLYITEVKMSIDDGTAMFPEIDKNIWKETSRVENLEGETYPAFDFVRYEK